MRTNVDIDDELMREAMELAGLESEETIEQALKEFVGWRRAQRDMLRLRGKIEWDGDLDEMRRNKSPEDGW